MNVQGILDGMVSHALTTAQFESVNTNEPKNAPGNGLTCAIWVNEMVPAVAASGLNSSSALIVFNVRIYTPMLSQPADAIDANVITACDALLTAYSGAFTLDGTVRDIDLLGAHGTPLRAVAGYINQSGTMMRVMTITVPMIVNDAWTQAP